MQEYGTESLRLRLMTRSSMNLRAEIRRLVDRVVLHLKIQKFIIYYHKPKWIVRFKVGKSLSFIESDGEMIDDPV
jgi:hypothetical protein